MRTLLAVLFVLSLAAVAEAQVPAVPGQSFKWNQTEGEVAAVTRYEVRVDAAPFVDAGKARADDAATPAGFQTFRFVIPALLAGPHTLEVRACFASGCTVSAPLGIVVVIVSVPSGLRIGPPE